MKGFIFNVGRYGKHRRAYPARVDNRHTLSHTQHAVPIYTLTETGVSFLYVHSRMVELYLIKGKMHNTRYVKHEVKRLLRWSCCADSLRYEQRWLGVSIVCPRSFSTVWLAGQTVRAAVSYRITQVWNLRRREASPALRLATAAWKASWQDWQIWTDKFFI